MSRLFGIIVWLCLASGHKGIFLYFREPCAISTTTLSVAYVFVSLSPSPSREKYSVASASARQMGRRGPGAIAYLGEKGNETITEFALTHYVYCLTALRMFGDLLGQATHHCSWLICLTRQATYVLFYFWPPFFGYSHIPIISTSVFLSCTFRLPLSVSRL